MLNLVTFGNHLRRGSRSIPLTSKRKCRETDRAVSDRRSPLRRLCYPFTRFTGLSSAFRRAVRASPHLLTNPLLPPQFERRSRRDRQLVATQRPNLATERDDPRNPGVLGAGRAPYSM